MNWFSEKERKEAANILLAGGVAVVPTDTLYGLVARAADKSAVERVYVLRKRAPQKPVIVLVASLDDLSFLGIALSVPQRVFLQKVWPGPVSVVLDCPDKEWEHIHRGTFSMAVRIPDNLDFREFVRLTGPLIAPSANTEGNPPARNIKEARGYFGEGADAYLDAGELEREPSTLVRLFADGSWEILREGAGKIKEGV